MMIFAIADAQGQPPWQTDAIQAPCFARIAGMKLALQ
jgi:hypothetical protein